MDLSRTGPEQSQGEMNLWPLMVIGGGWDLMLPDFVWTNLLRAKQSFQKATKTRPFLDLFVL